jgi:hypothetical protein
MDLSLVVVVLLLVGAMVGRIGRMALCGMSSSVSLERGKRAMRWI